MRKKIAICVCMLLIVTMLGASAMVLAKKPPTPPGGEPGIGTEYQITDDSQQQSSPCIQGNIIVWSDNRGEDWRDWNVYMYNLGPDKAPFTGDTGEGEYIVVGDPSKEEGSLGVYGNIVIFYRRDFDNLGEINVWMYHLGEDGIPGNQDVSWEGEFQLTDYEGAEWGSIYGTVIIWWSDSGVALDGIHALDLGANEIPDEGDEPLLLLGTAGGDGQKIYKNKITFHKDGDIYIYDFGIDINDLSDDTLTPLVKPYNQQWAFMYEDSLVWQDDRNGNLHIYYGEPGPDSQWGTEDDVENQITNPRRENDYHPSIYGDKIVWTRNWRKEGASHDPRTEPRKDNIYMYDLLTNEDYKLTTSDTADRPFIFENHIVYQDWRDNNWPVGNIYLFILN